MSQGWLYTTWCHLCQSLSWISPLLHAQTVLQKKQIACREKGDHTRRTLHCRDALLGLIIFTRKISLTLRTYLEKNPWFGENSLILKHTTWWSENRKKRKRKNRVLPHLELCNLGFMSWDSGSKTHFLKHPESQIHYLWTKQGSIRDFFEFSV